MDRQTLINQLSTLPKSTLIDCIMTSQKVNKDPTNIVSSQDRLYFYSKSADRFPGKGANEFVSNPSDYTELARIKDFRKVLSNFHYCPFVFEGKTYNTIEHVFQAKKTALVDPVRASYFTRESGHPIGQGDGLTAQKNRKLVILDKGSIAKWAQISDKVMEQAAIAKYRQCPEAMNVLKLTGKAQLWHIVARKQPVRFKHLERIRS